MEVPKIVSMTLLLCDDCGCHGSLWLVCGWNDLHQGGGRDDVQVFIAAVDLLSLFVVTAFIMSIVTSLLAVSLQRHASCPCGLAPALLG